jgi:hypothetical protein
MNPHEVKERNVYIAHFLGWWQEEPDESPYTWWKTSGLAITPVTEELTFHQEWNQLMLAVQAIIQLPTLKDVPPKNSIKYILVDELTIGRFGIYLTAYKDSVAQQPAERVAFWYRYHVSEPHSSNAKSHIQAVWLGVSDFCKVCNEYLGRDHNRFAIPKNGLHK